MNLLKRIDFRIIIGQWLGIFLLIHGVQKLHLAIKSRIYECLLFSFNNSVNNRNKIEYQNIYGISTKPEDCTCLENMNVGQFLMEKTYWGLFALIIGIISVSILNYKYKISVINSTLVLIMTVVLLFTGIYFKGKIGSAFNLIGNLITTNFKYQNIITGIILSFLGISLIWWIILKYKNTTSNMDLAKSEFNG